MGSIAIPPRPKKSKWQSRFEHPKEDIRVDMPHPHVRAVQTELPLHSRFLCHGS